MKHFKYSFVFILSLTLLGCGAYSFTGISTNANSFQVNFFQNNADLIEPGLDIEFTNALQDIIQDQTSLELSTSNADIIYEGEIVEYRISPTTATSDNRAAQNRVTMGVNVRYIDNLDEEKNFEKRFSFFYDYPAQAQLIGSQRDTAWEELFERITQDILNASLADW
ncbi:LptE family protein [Winogradskyella maritima]|uniref:LptE family protein n=1 Tax=Winogradskyella maritima TaxID=1517766 RepID=A0ABV8AH66_9FLAO|nr:LptE family protein [Winogradskyella maritima]